ncbi:MAG: sulfotransferase family protein [Gaiellaceae bacterium]
MSSPASAYPSVPSAGVEPLALEAGVPGPNVIGATGGSGTRVVARIVRESGLFTGADLNAYEDALPFGGYSDRWIDEFFAGAGEPASEELLLRMRADLDSVVRSHLADLPSSTRAWGWKEPRSIYYVPLLDAAMPSLRFLHFIRDGRDMAFSENQNQLVKHGDTVLGDDLRKAKTPVRSIAVWSLVNEAAADYGEERLGDRYLRVRFEDLCAEPAATVRSIMAFFGLDGDAEAAAAAVRPPDTLGRWQLRRKGIVEDLHRTAEPALARFGYL